MRSGRRLVPRPTLDEMRARAVRELKSFPDPLRRLEHGTSYPIEVGDALARLAAEVDRRDAQQEGS
jgi:nicotinate phosphoribosyltransferase